jgi:hypothetical protein
MDSSHFLEKEQPLNSSRLNSRLATEHIDVPEGDDSFQANLTRMIADAVGRFITTKQMLGILRVLKAVTFSFLILTIFADTMYIIFLEILANDDVRTIVGGTRDTIIRLYGLGLCFIAIGIEIDYSSVVKRFSGLKGFIPRSLLMFFIAMITSSSPMVDNYSTGQSQQSYNDGNYNNNDDAAAASGYGYGNGNAASGYGNGNAASGYGNGNAASGYGNGNAASGYGNGNAANGNNANGYGNYNDDATDIDWSTQYPSSAVNFQMVVAFVL